MTRNFPRENTSPKSGCSSIKIMHFNEHIIRKALIIQITLFLVFSMGFSSKLRQKIGVRPTRAVAQINCSAKPIKI